MKFFSWFTVSNYFLFPLSSHQLSLSLHTLYCHIIKTSFHNTMILLSFSLFPSLSPNLSFYPTHHKSKNKKRKKNYNAEPSLQFPAQMAEGNIRMENFIKIASRPWATQCSINFIFNKYRKTNQLRGIFCWMKEQLKVKLNPSQALVVIKLVHPPLFSNYYQDVAILN